MEKASVMVNREKRARQVSTKKDFTRVAKEIEITLGKRSVKVADDLRLHRDALRSEASSWRQQQAATGELRKSLF
ncbi:hypothetical protein [Janthinobacterium agaricidamnosum]|uniref:hypothetical protein n=1 Tax=Janthinobacterium agaricidamnosum TaxID=55508 RepID=UPI0013CE9192|nr:hypothetical protein [Janthinobacterium agaricidamnosum]